jgi:hypothetical protein
MGEQETVGDNYPERKKPGFLQEVKERVRREKAKNRLFNFGKRMAGWTPSKEVEERKLNKGWDIPPSFRQDYLLEDGARDEFLAHLNSFSNEWPEIDAGDKQLNAIKLTVACGLSKLFSRHLLITIEDNYSGYETIGRIIEMRGSGIKISGFDNRTEDGSSRETISPRRPSTDFLERFPSLIQSGKWIRKA